MLRSKAHAKINLSLEITGRRSDGFHDLISVMQQVQIADELTVCGADTITVRCSDPTLNGTENLVYRAASLLQSRFGVSRGCRIELKKVIPVAAGLGGGSSDAAATIRALADLWNLEVGLRDVLPLAAELGSDVPFFLYGGTALVTGRGEDVTALPVQATAWYLLANPGITVSTGAVFAALRADEWMSGERTRRLACDMTNGDAAGMGINNLVHALFRVAPAARACYDLIERIAPDSTFVSGSGPTVIARFPDRESAQAAKDRLGGSGYWTAVTHSIAARSEQTWRT